MMNPNVNNDTPPADAPMDAEKIAELERSVAASSKREAALLSHNTKLAAFKRGVLLLLGLDPETVTQFMEADE